MSGVFIRVGQTGHHVWPATGALLMSEVLPSGREIKHLIGADSCPSLTGCRVNAGEEQGGGKVKCSTVSLTVAMWQQELISAFQQVLNLIFRKTTHTHSHTVCHYIQLFLSLSLYSKWQNHRLHTPSWGTGHIHLYTCPWPNTSSLKHFWYHFSIIKLCA